ncbi:tetratricopeptide repeat protein [Vibrio atypicus]|uniref:tetratricopeptide repeat protein n=1 Tax=Vibrio atypicus TaxID=558271 RepID=UPI003734F621
MYKITVLLSIALFTGCVSTSSSDRTLDKETLLIQAQNYNELVGYYKSELAKKDTTETRIKLARSYLRVKDADSALFTLKPLIAQKNTSSEALLVNASSLYELGDFKQGLIDIEQAKILDPSNAEIQNLSGLLYSANGDYNKARIMFNLARSNFYDDITVKNNLAVLDIIEGHYLDAVQRLMPIYTNEQADSQVQANLMLALAKLGNFEYVRTMLGPEVSEEDAFNHFAALRNSEPTSRTNSEVLINSDTKEAVQ